MKFEVEEQHPKKKKKKRLTKRQKMIALIFFLFLVLIFLLTLLLFMPKKEEEKVPVKKEKKEPVVEEKHLQIVDENSKERPIAIMIDNNIGSARHEGLQDSYITYEIIVEGGLTRMMALYKDKEVEKIGPVRSSRHYFLDYALESGAIYAHFGWSPYAEKDISYLGVNNINGMVDDAPYWRESGAIAPHNVFTSTNKLRETAKSKGYSLESDDWRLLNYSIDEIELFNPNEDTGAILANSVWIPYSYAQNRSYTYDSEHKYYLRSMNGVAHMDRSTDEQYHYKNIIIESVRNFTLDSEGRQDLDTEGSGTGYYITNGYALPIHWQKDSRKGKTRYTYEDGNEITVNDGNTFIQIIPTSSTVGIE